jgi:hypothetical protein
MAVDTFDGASNSPTPVRGGKAPKTAAAAPPRGGSAHGVPGAVEKADGTANLRANGTTYEKGLPNGRALTSSVKPTRAAVQTYNDRGV